MIGFAFEGAYYVFRQAGIVATEFAQNYKHGYIKTTRIRRKLQIRL